MASRYQPDPRMQPRLATCGSAGTGILQQFPLSRYMMDELAQLAVNLANGNLVIDDSDHEAP